MILSTYLLGIYGVRASLTGALMHSQNLSYERSTGGMGSSSSRKINLEDLCEGIRNLTPVRGADFAEAGAVSLDRQGHSSGVSIKVSGEYNEDVEVKFADVTESMRKSWADIREAVDHGASGIAILFMRDMTKLTVIERSSIGPGFDYWLGPEGKEDDELIFQDKVRLEISGINVGNTADVKRRVGQKLDQTNPSDSWGLPAYVVVVEFGRPCSQIAKK
jgi:hypothetical protein